MQQRAHPRGRARLLRDGARRIIFSAHGDDQPPQRPGRRAHRTGHLDGAAHAPANGDDRFRNRRHELRQRLHPASGIHRLGRSRLLRAARRRRDRSPKKTAGR